MRILPELTRDNSQLRNAQLPSGLPIPNAQLPMFFLVFFGNWELKVGSRLGVAELWSWELTIASQLRLNLIAY
jgi:hypothetical protein